MSLCVSTHSGSWTVPGPDPFPTVYSLVVGTDSHGGKVPPGRFPLRLSRTPGVGPPGTVDVFTHDSPSRCPGVYDLYQSSVTHSPTRSGRVDQPSTGMSGPVCFSRLQTSPRPRFISWSVPTPTPSPTRLSPSPLQTTPRTKIRTPRETHFPWGGSVVGVGVGEGFS